MSSISEILGRGATNADVKRFLNDNESLESYINSALESISELSKQYSNLCAIKNEIAATECYDYTEFVALSFAKRVAFINNNIKGHGIESISLESITDVNVALEGVKDIALAIWKKIKEWYKSLVRYIDNFLANSKNGIKLIGTTLVKVGNDLLKGKIAPVTENINVDSLDYKAGLFTSDNVYNDFMDLSRNYCNYVGDPVFDTATQIGRVFENLLTGTINTTKYENLLSNAISKIAKTFNEKAPSGVSREDILPGAMFTPNIFAGARLQAGDVIKSKLDKLEDNSVSKISFVIEKASGTQLIKPLNGREILRMAGDITNGSNPWLISNKNRFDHLIKLLNDDIVEYNSKMPNELVVELANKAVRAYSTVIIQYTAEFYKLYTYAIKVVHAVAKASVKPL